MPIQNPFAIPLMQLGRTIIRLKPVLIDAIGTEALHFIDDNFEKECFQGDPDQPWEKLKHPPKRKRKILNDTLALRRSMAKTDSTDHTTIHTDIAYAKIHNEGGEIRHPYREVIMHYTSHKAVDYEMTGRKILKLAKHTTETQQRKVKEIRRSSVSNHITKMPKRQFAGTSPVLTRRCEKTILKVLIANIPN